MSESGPRLYIVLRQSGGIAIEQIVGDDEVGPGDAGEEEGGDVDDSDRLL